MEKAENKDGSTGTAPQSLATEGYIFLLHSTMGTTKNQITDLTAQKMGI